MKTKCLAILAASILLGSTGTAEAQNGLPQYCITEAGVLGPFSNAGNIRVGDPCFGTSEGRRYDRTAVMGFGYGDELPRYCQTEVGILGPYDNTGTLQVGDPCSGTLAGRRYGGRAVMHGPDSGEIQLPRFCSTQVGILGPYDNPGTIQIGDPCFGSIGEQRYPGKAVLNGPPS